MAFLKQPEKVKLLGRVPLFADCTKKQLTELSRYTTQTEFPQDTVLAEQGTVGDQAMILVKGTAVVRRNNRKVAELRPGAMIGEMSLITDMPRNADVIATSNVDLLVMSADDFEHVMEVDPKLAVRVLRTVGQRLADNLS